MREDELQRLGPERVRLLHQIGYFRDLDEQAREKQAAHEKRRQQARRTLQRLRRNQ